MMCALCISVCGYLGPQTCVTMVVCVLRGMVVNKHVCKCCVCVCAQIILFPCVHVKKL